MSSSLTSTANQPATFSFAYRYNFACKSIFSGNISPNLHNAKDIPYGRHIGLKQPHLPPRRFAQHPPASLRFGERKGAGGW